MKTTYATLTAGLLARKGQAAAATPSLAPATFPEAGPVEVTWRDTTLVPRGLTKRQAAAYVGVSPTTFKKLVAAGVFGPPMVLASRRRWDRLVLDQSFDRMSGLKG